MDDLTSFFSLVDTRSERQRAYTLLVDSGDDFQVQLPDKSLVNCKGLSLKDNFIFIQNSYMNDAENNSEVIVTFALGKEKYFLKTKLYINKQNKYHIDLSPPLYKLQRRSNFRVRIPLGYGAKVEINSINETHVSIILPLGDLSAGGFSFEASQNLEIKIEKGQYIKGNILVGGKFKKNFEALVRHIGHIGSKGSGLIKCGLEFQNLSTTDKETFMKVTMELQRDMFSTFKIGTR